jgi:hypothetical protein
MLSERVNEQLRAEEARLNAAREAAAAAVIARCQRR